MASQESEFWLCPDCNCFHGLPPLENLLPGVPCGHNQKAACKLCGWPVGPLSTAGSDTCSYCAAGFKRVPPPEPEDDDDET